MWGITKTEDNCHNCGAKGFESSKKDYECKHCGYKIVAPKEMPECTLVFCDVCGCTLTDNCPTHGQIHCTPIKIKTAHETGTPDKKV